jgi:hypothetical protein
MCLVNLQGELKKVSGCAHARNAVRHFRSGFIPWTSIAPQNSAFSSTPLFFFCSRTRFTALSSRVLAGPGIGLPSVAESRSRRVTGLPERGLPAAAAPSAAFSPPALPRRRAPLSRRSSGVRRSTRFDATRRRRASIPLSLINCENLLANPYLHSTAYEHITGHVSPAQGALARNRLRSPTLLESTCPDLIR